MGSLGKFCMLAAAACSVALAQESATVRGPEVVKAGEVVDLEISVDTAPNFDGGGVMVWVANVQSSCDLPRGEKVCHFKFRTPVDASSGTYYVTKLAFWTGSRQIDLPFKKIGFQVIANSGLVFRASAEVRVKPSQVQLLRGEIVGWKSRKRRDGRGFGGTFSASSGPWLCEHRSRRANL
jgi:hypothetical protein